MISKEKALPQYIVHGIEKYRRIKDLLKGSEGTISVPGNAGGASFELKRSGLKRIQWGIWKDLSSFGIKPAQANKKLGEIIKSPFI